jgi:hypothetical protein
VAAWRQLNSKLASGAVVMARGSIYEYQLADGRRRWRVVYRTSNGVQKHKRGFKGSREAELFLNQMMASVDRGQVISPVIGGRIGTAVPI